VDDFGFSDDDLLLQYMVVDEGFDSQLIQEFPTQSHRISAPATLQRANKAASCADKKFDFDSNARSFKNPVSVTSGTSGGSRDGVHNKNNCVQNNRKDNGSSKVISTTHDYNKNSVSNKAKSVHNNAKDGVNKEGRAVHGLCSDSGAKNTNDGFSKMNKSDDFTDDLDFAILASICEYDSFSVSPKNVKRAGDKTGNGPSDSKQPRLQKAYSLSASTKPSSVAPQKSSLAFCPLVSISRPGVVAPNSERSTKRAQSAVATASSVQLKRSESSAAQVENSTSVKGLSYPAFAHNRQTKAEDNIGNSLIRGSSSKTGNISASVGSTGTKQSLSVKKFSFKPVGSSASQRLTASLPSSGSRPAPVQPVAATTSKTTGVGGHRTSESQAKTATNLHQQHIPNAGESSVKIMCVHCFVEKKKKNLNW
jgi:hypothetical protein